VTGHAVVGLDGRPNRRSVAQSSATVPPPTTSVVETSTALLDLLGDDYARAILLATADRPMSAKELTRALDMSQPTVSRRLRRLKALGLVREEVHLDPSGHHAGVYRAAIDELTVSLDDDGFRVRVERPVDPPERMSYIWQQLRWD